MKDGDKFLLKLKTNNSMNNLQEKVAIRNESLRLLTLMEGPEQTIQDRVMEILMPHGWEIATPELENAIKGSDDGDLPLRGEG